MKKILITGAKGFIGKNLIAKLNENKEISLLKYDVENSEEELIEALKEADFIYHLAGVNRPKDEKEFIEGNSRFTHIITRKLQELNKATPILITSSIQAELNNPYGISKKQAEEELIKYSKTTGADVFIYRLPNVFGKWCRPNYNSVIATFCYNISHELDIWISDENKEINLVYIDDVVDEFIAAQDYINDYRKYYYSISKTYKAALGDIVHKIKSFQAVKETSIIPDFSDEFTKCLYSTYLSYLEKDNFSYGLEKKEDHRGWLSEILKSKESGQIFISQTHKGIVRGNHYHHSKVEKFIVIKGEALIRFRKIDENEVFEYRVKGEDLKVVDIPPGYTHSIENVGEDELMTLFWANEIFNQDKPDTYFSEVLKHE